MKATKVLPTAILLLLPATIVPGYAQEHGQEKQPEQKQQQAKPARPQQRAEQKQQAKPAQPQQRAEHQQQAKPSPTRQQSAQHQEQAKPAQRQQPAGRQQQATRAQSAGNHGRIPDARFRESFGRGHTFRVSRSEFAGGSRRFQYGGYWFALINPWPVGWLYTDDVYVDYMNGGYFLCDPIHPGVYLSISIG